MYDIIIKQKCPIYILAASVAGVQYKYVFVTNNPYNELLETILCNNTIFVNPLMLN